MTWLLNGLGSGQAIEPNTPTSTWHEHDTITQIDTPIPINLIAKNLFL